MRVLIGAMVALAGLAAAEPMPSSWCKEGEACWPTAADIAALSASMGPADERRLLWAGPPTPIPAAVPVYSPSDQPLYGLGYAGLQGVYVRASPSNDTCFGKATEPRLACLAATRNNPLEGWRPFLTVFADTPARVQAAVRFANKHKMCISVAGTGHDFLNRHSCPDGMFIRTTMLKGAKLSADNTTVTVGSGSTFSEVQALASSAKRFVAAGWARTVGVAGWSMGGGHGPFGNAVGLGVDNIVSAEVVTANGSLVTASATENADLWWALRGGGGSAFGVLTSLTLRAHALPEAGLVFARVAWVGDFCAPGLESLKRIMSEVIGWLQESDPRYSTIAFFTPTASDASQCGANWTAYAQTTCLGSQADCDAGMLNITSLPPPALANVTAAPDWYTVMQQYPLETITPVPWTGHGVPSVLVPRSAAADGSLQAALLGAVEDCAASGVCARMELYFDIAGAKGSPRSPDVSIGGAFRSAFLHLVYGGPRDPAPLKALGDGAYLSESDYTMPDDEWPRRYWGDNVARLVQVKRRWDPHDRFWCRHCVHTTLQA